jgi:hypothetical protein
VECLVDLSAATANASLRTNLVNEQLRDRLLLDVYHILPKDTLTVLFLISVNSSSNRLHICPGRILPAVAKNEFIFQGMERESHISIVEDSEFIQDGINILIVDNVLLFGSTKNCR